MRTPADMPRPLPRTSRRFRVGVLVAIVVLIILLTSVRGAARFYTSYLWFKEVGFTSVFRGVLVTKILLAVTFCIIFFLMLFGSLSVADRCAPDEIPEDSPDELVVRYRDVITPIGRWVRIAAAVVFALFAGIGTNKEWNNFDLYRYSVSFGIKDPEYGRDIGFYVFKLPFIKFLLGWAFEAVIVVLLVTAVAQYLNGGIRFQGAGPRVTPAVKTHISLLLGILAVIQAVNYYFDRLQLVLGTGRVVDGATATSVHATKPADALLIAIAVIAAVLFLLNIRAKGWTLPVVGVVVWALVWILVGHIYPALYQSLRVQPSELTRETPYIDRNIAATRSAYGLKNVTLAKDPAFDGASTETVSASQIGGTTPAALTNQSTLANVQLLDPNQVLNTFNQLQALRSFYTINSLQVDRYDFGDSLTETLIGVRELNSSVPNGFTTEHLQYTHGYGAAVSPANQAGVVAAGQPNFSLSNVPPVGQPSLSSDTGAQVYYGEGSEANGFVIAKSKQEELDYETTNGQEATNHYSGSGGVPAGSLLRRAIFALSFSSPDILLSGQVTPSSRIIYNRNIVARVKKAAPFLGYDADPYSVILGNQIYWIVDAYTTTANYPYSQDADTNRVSGASGLSGRFNYVRNSVKVVINAYTGKMYFFVVDPNDPIIRVYERAFPDLFTPGAGNEPDHFIDGITAHWRYPEDLFKIQTNMYGRYHLTDTTQFFTQANAWNISQDPGSGRPGTGNLQQTTNANGTVTSSQKQLDPSYEVAALPGDLAGQTQQQFLLVQPFVPLSAASTRQNLTAMLYASSDPGQYGKLTLYETPPNQTVNSPDLVQSLISNAPAISEEFTFYNQQSSEVLLGELVTVPISNTLLYVQPVYVQSSTNKIPTLRDVIVVYNGVVYHSSNASLDAALCQITNPDDSKPFASYCNTAAADRTKNQTPTTQTNPTTPTTTTPTTSTTLPTSSATAPPGSQTVAELLAAAQRSYVAAEAALKAGDLAGYQRDNAQAQADVDKAASLDGSKSTTSTTGGPGGRSTTTTTPSPSKTKRKTTTSTTG